MHVTEVDFFLASQHSFLLWYYSLYYRLMVVVTTFCFVQTSPPPPQGCGLVGMTPSPSSKLGLNQLKTKMGLKSNEETLYEKGEVNLETET